VIAHGDEKWMEVIERPPQTFSFSYFHSQMEMEIETEKEKPPNKNDRLSETVKSKRE
jgi:hypothetical protein